MSAPPPGPPPSPEYLAWDIRPRLLGVDLTLFGIAALTMLMRIYVRVFMLKTFGLDDWLMVIAMALSITSTGLFIKVITLGMGKHIEAFNQANYPAYFKYMYIYAILIIFAYSFIKLSIGFFLLRLADRTRWRRFLQGTLAFLVVFTLGSTLAIIFQCIPVKAAYDFSLRPPLGNAKCYDPDVFKNVGVFNSSINIATDLLFALIPIPIVWKLQVNVRTKVGLGAIMGLGLFASATAIYKVPMQYNFFKEPDFTGRGAWYYIWQQVEMNIGITAANLPTLKPLFANFFSNLRALSAYGSRTARSGRTTPYKATGYLKQSDAGFSHAENSFAMSNLSRSAGGGSRGVAGEEEKTWASSSLSKRGSQSGESDETILREHGMMGRGRSTKGIVRTTEVDVKVSS